MPERPITLRLPPICPYCGHNTIHLQQSFQGTRVLLEWACKECGKEWLVRHKDEDPSTP
jgi:hypothetical protein